MADERQPLVSVVTPSLNQVRYVEETIHSVAEQDYPHIEHIVVDGGSTDGTLDVLRRHPRVRWISEPDRGQADALNKGFGMSSGEVLAWLNADDVYLAGAISTAVAALQRSGAALVYGGWRQLDEGGTTIKDVGARPYDYRELLEVRNLIAQPSAFFTREAFENVGGVDAGYQYAMDYELWLRIGARYEIRRIDGILAGYRFHPNSKTVASYGQFWAETHRASRRHGGRYFSPMYLRSLPERRRSVARGLAVWRYVRAGDIRGLLALLRRGPDQT